MVVEGILTRPPERTLNGVRLYVDAQTLVREAKSIPTTGMIQVTLPDFGYSLDYGDRVRLQTDAPLSLTAEITPAAAAALALRPGDSIWLSIKATEVSLAAG